jgi:hypothetical protein
MRPSIGHRLKELPAEQHDRDYGTSERLAYQQSADQSEQRNGVDTEAPESEKHKTGDGRVDKPSDSGHRPEQGCAAVTMKWPPCHSPSEKKQNRRREEHAYAPDFRHDPRCLRYLRCPCLFHLGLSQD